MEAEDLIKNNALTDITVCKGQKVVILEIALTALNMAKKEAYNQAIDNVLNIAKVKEIQKISGYDPRPYSEYIIDKEPILKLKK